ncbi:RING-type domain-containing protein [Caenorhabditis elegans]|uniref:RING-type domain-containing protein n=1 Tax=Caenorhabditis elegans TaxID=6239 RepID=A0A8D9MZS8_CAEEL|nr:RING-type domain-containing protein [Caenorhabditis elegans]CCD72575.2 RING-type domain-containing protein [Caenorhabditis elegans]
MASRLECSICFFDFDDFQHLPKLLENCGHTFCYSCLFDWLKSQDTCPMCREAVNMTQEIPTNVEILAVFEKKKANPECNCDDESSVYYCPTCMLQNYANWEDRRESGEHTFCFGCACNHMDEHEHKIKQLGMGSEISLEIDKDDGKTLDDKKSCISSKKRVLYFLSILVIAVIILFVLCIYFKMI